MKGRAKMSAWKELQLALMDDSKTEEELDEYRRTWEYECRRDWEIDKALEEMERKGETL